MQIYTCKNIQMCKSRHVNDPYMYLLTEPRRHSVLHDLSKYSTNIIIGKFYLAGLSPLCNRMLKNADFTKRLGAATKDFAFCKFQFQTVRFRLNTVLHLLK